MTEEETMMGGEIEVRRDTRLVLPGTGETFDLAEPVQAAQAVHAIKDAEERLEGMRREAEQFLIEEAQRQGRKTLRFDETRLMAEISGGPGATYIDPVELRAGLERAGCPADRIEAAIKTSVEEKADRAVCRQLATNPEYKRAIDAATRIFEKRYTVRVA